MLLFVLLCFLPFSSLSSPKIKQQPFVLDSDSPKPTFIFIREILNEFQRLQPDYEKTTFAYPLYKLLELSKAFKTTARLKNYNEIADLMTSSKEVYYLTQIALQYSKHSPPQDDQSIVERFVKDIIEHGNAEVSDYLIEIFNQYQFPILARILFQFLKEDDQEDFLMLLGKCPNLINFKLDPDGSGQKLTLLAMAAKRGDYRLASELISRGADVNAIVLDDLSYGPYPVLYCVMNNDFTSSLEILNLFLEAPEFDIERCVDSQGLSPAFHLIERGLGADMLDLLVSYFGWEKPLPGMSKLMNTYGFALAMGNHSCAKIIEHQHDFNPELVDADGASYLMLAAEFNNAEMIDHLIISYGRECYQISPGYSDHFGRTAIMIAISNRSYDALKVLVHNACEPEINSYGSNPLSWAIFYQDSRCVEIILSHPQVSLRSRFADWAGDMTVYEYATEIVGNPDITNRLNQCISS